MKRARGKREGTNIIGNNFNEIQKLYNVPAGGKQQKGLYETNENLRDVF